jgi:hypothetical protein
MKYSILFHPAGESIIEIMREGFTTIEEAKKELQTIADAIVADKNHRDGIYYLVSIPYCVTVHTDLRVAMVDNTDLPPVKMPPPPEPWPRPKALEVTLEKPQPTAEKEQLFHAVMATDTNYDGWETDEEE